MPKPTEDIIQLILDELKEIKKYLKEFSQIGLRVNPAKPEPVDPAWNQ